MKQHLGEIVYAIRQLFFSPTFRHQLTAYFPSLATELLNAVARFVGRSSPKILPRLLTRERERMRERASDGWTWSPCEQISSVQTAEDDGDDFSVTVTERARRIRWHTQRRRRKRQGKLSGELQIFQRFNFRLNIHQALTTHTRQITHTHTQGVGLRISCHNVYPHTNLCRQCVLRNF